MRSLGVRFFQISGVECFHTVLTEHLVIIPKWLTFKLPESFRGLQNPNRGRCSDTSD